MKEISFVERFHYDDDAFAIDQAVLRGDLRKLQKVVCNLLSNALMFTPKGGTITVTAKKLVIFDQPSGQTAYIKMTNNRRGSGSVPSYTSVQPDSYVFRIEVKDNGYGISEVRKPLLRHLHCCCLV